MRGSAASSRFPNRLFRVASPALFAITVLAPRVLRAQSVLPVPAQVTLTVDESQEARRIAFVHEEIRVQPGPVSLAYPKWIPGEHGPTGPIQEMAALQIHAGSTPLSWTRDPDDIFTFQVQVPAGTSKITVDFDTLLENTISDHQILLAWNTTVLYPVGIDKRELTVQPSVILPPGWTQQSSLRSIGQSGARFDFAPTSLERLIDSPLVGGEFTRAIPLASSWPAELDVASESQYGLDHLDDSQAIALFGKLVDQDRAMFGFRHWDKFHLLISLSSENTYDGLEHEDSPWCALAENGLSSKDMLEEYGWVLLAHEQSHSWDGKYRRPGELYSKPDYQGPERTSLVWVYEGLNEYIGSLLATRAGFNNPQFIREYLAASAARYAISPGRKTSPLVDTATESWVVRNVPAAWSSLRRGQDYYDEGALIWLRVDTIIRQQTHGKAALDDFLRSFFGQRDTPPIVAPYRREEVEAALNTICPYDWHDFFESHIYQINSKPPTDGVEAAGWRLVYNDTPNKSGFNLEGENPVVFHGAFSLGFSVRRDGRITDVIQGSPAYDAGISPNMDLLSVEGQVFSADALEQATAHPKNGAIELVVRNFKSIETRTVRYDGGLRYPHLEAIPGVHDYLTEILAPRATN